MRNLRWAFFVRLFTEDVEAFLRITGAEEVVDAE